MDFLPGQDRSFEQAAAVAWVTCVVVTHDRPALLRRCLAGVMAQLRRPDEVLVVDNASGPATAAAIAEFRGVETLRLARNEGGAAGFRAGILRALDRGCDLVWLMDDDGEPAEASCLSTLLAEALAGDVDITAPLVLDDVDPTRLAFAIRLGGRSRFTAADVQRHGAVEGFAHLFNGALIRASLFDRIGMPDARFVLRGDEVDFLYRARGAGARIRLLPRARFLHPGSSGEVHAILGGMFFAVVPASAGKRYLLARNRAFIFLRHRRWLMLAADVVRYGCHFLMRRPADFAGFGLWARATFDGLRGRFCDPSEALGR